MEVRSETWKYGRKEDIGRKKRKKKIIHNIIFRMGEFWSFCSETVSPPPPWCYICRGGRALPDKARDIKLISQCQ